MPAPEKEPRTAEANLFSMGGRWGRRRGAALGVLLAAAASAVIVAPPARSAPASNAQVVPDAKALCGTATSAAITPAPDDGVLRIVSFNLLHSDTDEGDLSLGSRLPLEAQAIATAGADIVGAQEVTRNLTLDAANEYPQKHGTVAERLAGLLASLTGDTWSWCWSLSNPHVPLTPDLDVGGGNALDRQAAARGNLPDPGDFSEGLAILTRFPILDARMRRLLPRSYEAVGCTDGDPFCPLDAIFDSRQLLWAHIATPTGPIDMFTTHLAHHITALSEDTKLLQAQQVTALIGDVATPDANPDVLVGDFNSTPTSKVHQHMIDSGFVDTYHAAGGPECPAGGGAGCSGDPPIGQESFTAAPTRTMSERIDYVWARPPSDCSLTVPASNLIADVPEPLPDGRYLWPSDHYGFVSELQCHPPAGNALAAPAVRAADQGATQVLAAEVEAPMLPATGDSRPALWALTAAALMAAALLMGRIAFGSRPLQRERL